MALALAGAGCSHGAPERRAPVEPRVVLTPEGAAPVTVKVEVARSDAETQRGLMYRERLDDGRGMLFLFREPRKMVFWMRNTYIPLDMIFITPAKSVLGVVESAQPLTDDPRSVDGISQYVLEVPGGWAAKNRIAPGTPVKFVDVE
jgi:uncharacterized membrane protein (UPF0127 family)